MVAKVSRLTNKRPIVDEKGVTTQEARSYFNSVNNLLMITGEGSPESAVSAIQGALYTDLSGTTGTVLYVKILSDISGDDTRGWVLV